MKAAVLIHLPSDNMIKVYRRTGGAKMSERNRATVLNPRDDEEHMQTTKNDLKNKIKVQRLGKGKVAQRCKELQNNIPLPEVQQLVSSVPDVYRCC